jgi:hypothetical protein
MGDRRQLLAGVEDGGTCGHAEHPKTGTPFLTTRPF